MARPQWNDDGIGSLSIPTDSGWTMLVIPALPVTDADRRLADEINQAALDAGRAPIFTYGSTRILVRDDVVETVCSGFALRTVAKAR